MEGLCTDEFTGELHALLRQGKHAAFVRKTTEAQEQFATKAAQVKKYHFEILFDSQPLTLENRGTPQTIVDLLCDKRDPVIAKAIEMMFENGHVPFLPVISQPYWRSLSDLMSAVRPDVMAGYTNLDPTKVTDTVETSGGLYYAYNIENGEHSLCNNLEKARGNCERNGRSPLTVAECIALATHTDVLKRYKVLAASSSYGPDDRLLGVQCDDGRTQLLSPDAETVRSDPSWRLPTLGSREL